MRLEWLQDDLDNSEASLIIDPPEISFEPAGYRYCEKLGNLVGVQFLERFLEAVNGSGPRFQHHNDLGLIGELVFPTIERSRRGQDRPAGDQTSIEQCPDEFGSFVGCGQGGENDDSVGVAHVANPGEVSVTRI